MNGVVVVEKPANMTSACVVAKVKGLLRAKKVGHTGTLDPFATGVLVCCVNRATRLARFLMAGKKYYEAVMCLGVRTDTHDLTGRVVSTEMPRDFTHDRVRSAFRRFLGMKEQVPPVFSALKHQGVPLYKLARRGTMVQKPARRIAIYALDVQDVALPYVRFRVCCSQGTYIRTLCADIGETLGCGAHLVSLCRTENGGFTLEEAISLESLEKLAAAQEVSKCIIPMDSALRAMPEIQAGPGLQQRIQHGEPLSEAELGQVEEVAARWIKITDGDRNLLAVLAASKKNGVFPYVCVLS